MRCVLVIYYTRGFYREYLCCLTGIILKLYTVSKQTDPEVCSHQQCTNVPPKHQQMRVFGLDSTYVT